MCVFLYVCQSVSLPGTEERKAIVVGGVLERLVSREITEFLQGGNTRSYHKIT